MCLQHIGCDGPLNVVQATPSRAFTPCGLPQRLFDALVDFSNRKFSALDVAKRVAAGPARKDPANSRILACG